MPSCFCTGACHKYGTCNGLPPFPLAGSGDYVFPTTYPDPNIHPAPYITSPLPTIPQWPVPQRLGWQCPKCSTIYSPDIQKCNSFTCTSVVSYTASSTGQQLLNEGK